MNRYFIILSALLAVVILAFGAVLLLRVFFSSPAGPVQTIPTTIPSDSQTSSQANRYSKIAVQAAFQNVLAKRPSDNTKLYKTVVADDFALQIWAGDIMGGQALLKYDSARDTWVLLDAGGGSWSVGTLVDAGVPQSTAESLLAGLSQ